MEGFAQPIKTHHVTPPVFHILQQGPGMIPGILCSQHGEKMGLINTNYIAELKGLEKVIMSKRGQQMVMTNKCDPRWSYPHCCWYLLRLPSNPVLQLLLFLLFSVVMSHHGLHSTPGLHVRLR